MPSNSDGCGSATQMWLMLLFLGVADVIATNDTTVPGTTGPTTEFVPTSPDPILSVCEISKVDYEEDHCYCQLDPCLDAIFEAQDHDWCPQCAIGPTTTDPPITTTADIDWATLFTSEEPSTTTTTATTTRNNDTTTSTSTTTTTTSTTTTSATSTTTTTTTPTTTTFTTTTFTTTMSTTSTTSTSTTTTTPTTTTTLEMLNMTHGRCNRTQWGIKITRLSNFTGEKCCCPHFPGDRLEVTLELATYTYPHGVDWENVYSDYNHPRTRALKRRLAQELAMLAMKATNKTLTSFKFVSMEKSYPIQVKVTFRVTVAQSRSANADTFKENLRDLLTRYRDLPTSQLVFGETFRGYVKTGFFTDTITVERYYDAESAPPTTTATPTSEAVAEAEPEKENKSVMIALLVVGAILVVVILVYIVAGGKICFCGDWC